LDRFKRKIGEPAAAGPAVDPTWVGDGPPVADPTRADLPLVDPTVPIDPDRAPAGGGNGRDEWTEHEAPPPEPDPAAEPAEDQPDVLAEGLFQPWISSVDGVEVDPVPPPPEPGTTPERADEKREA